MGVYDDVTPRSILNKIDLAILGGVTGATLIGFAVDHLVFRKKLKGSAADRPRGWVMGMLISSYILLVPGLFKTLFGYRIGVMNGLKVMSERKENMLEFAVELFRSGSGSGCFFVVGFAFVLPIVKLILLVVGGVLRHSSDEKKKAWSRQSILFVQRISKWASPDMFAYILLSYLIRGLNHPPILNGNFDLDIGFSCFATFCVASTISSLGVRMPSQEDLGKEAPMAPWGFTPMPVLIVTCVLCILFAVAMAFGLSLPCMSLRLDMQLLYESGQISEDLRPIIEMLHVQELAANDVSLMDCIQKLWQWIPPDMSDEDNPKGWEVNSAIAFVLLSVLVVAFTIISMCVLLVIAVLLQVKATKQTKLLELAHVFRKLSMLDVLIAGVVVIVLAGRIYEKSGVVLKIQSGLFYLLAAEIIHYIVYYMVSLTGKSVRDQADNDSEKGLDIDARDSLRDYSRQEADEPSDSEEADASESDD